MATLKSLIQFFAEDVDHELPNPTKARRWLKFVIDQEEHELNSLNYIFCSDEYLLNMNREHLNHDYYTDIITFDTSDEEKQVEGEIYISIDRVNENAATANVKEDEELRRVMVHGVLHLLGYDDDTDSNKEKIRDKEDYYLKNYKYQ
ncbi:rRNA maturation RNase YbeY [Persicitalea jodogahamensis]|uniref:Endoribonuclease YbeY n=1 Tax=Persicitalea jodogahamensis TaxID=402147 RepID=A0A8J3D8E7_9BACT|nr:rRNA maturation RNase YbeY [Persicitalea jodogahamensis]GHB89146.1 endoribonuclease YbeY [Persicitalea jodogahamensis]